jgi:thiamine-phosphate pyrophosphorylase
MRRPISNLHYLTLDLAHITHQQQVRNACEVGVKWVQLRVKNKSLDEWMNIAREVKLITDEFGATLIINDNVLIAKEIDADGVHLGQQDLNWKEARKILGEEKLIGFSTHSFEGLNEAKNFDVDYFGLGPFRFTSTKEKLNAVLGLDGIEKIISKARGEKISKTIIAIGGIQLQDVDVIMNAGANGIAVSSAINLASDSRLAVSQFIFELASKNI